MNGSITAAAATRHCGDVNGTKKTKGKGWTPIAAAAPACGDIVDGSADLPMRGCRVPSLSEGWARLRVESPLLIRRLRAATRGSRLGAWLALALAWSLFPSATAQPPTSAAPAAPAMQMQVEAAFLVNFVRYTDWPPQRFAGPGEPYVISVVGSRDASATVHAIASAAGSIQGRPILVRHVDFPSGRRAADPAQLAQAVARLRGSHLVFLPAAARIPPAAIVDAVRGAQVLTVSDVPDFVEAGGMLGLVRVGGHLAFQANPAAIQEAGLLVSAKVLKLAQLRPGGAP